MRPDQSENLAKMTDLFQRQKEAGNPPLFVITGVTGSGKSILAETLADDGSKAAYVNMRPVGWKSSERPHLRDQIPLSATTFIVDEAVCANPDTFADTVNHMLNDGATVVLVAQYQSDIPYQLLSSAAVAHVETFEITQASVPIAAANDKTREKRDDA